MTRAVAIRCLALFLATAGGAAAQPESPEVAAVRAIARETKVIFGDVSTDGKYVYHVTLGDATTDAHVKRLVALRPTMLSKLYLRAEVKFDGKRRVSSVSPAGLKELATLPALKFLYLAYPCGDDDLKAVAGLSNLEDVTAGSGFNDGFNPVLTKAGVGYLAELPKLRTLGLDDTTLGGDCWEPLSKFPALESLRVYTRSPGKGIGRLAALPKLKELNLPRTQFGDDALAELVGVKSLRSLDLTHARVTDDGLKHLAGMTELQHLKLSGTKVTDAGVRHLAGMRGLVTLDLSQTQVGDGGVKALAGLKSLNGLRLGLTKVGDEGVKALAGQGGIVNLDLYGTGVTDEGFKELAKLKKLWTLDVGQTNVTPEAVSRLKLALPNCAVSHSRPVGGPG